MLRLSATRPERSTIVAAIERLLYITSSSSREALFACAPRTRIDSLWIMARQHCNTLAMLTKSPSWFVMSQKATADLERSALVPALVFTTLALLVVLRWYSGLYLAPGTWHREDAFVTFAFLLSIGMTAVIGAEFRVDMTPTNKRHTSLPSLSYMLKLVFAKSLLYQIAVNSVKTAFTYQYLHIFSHLQYPRYYCYFLLVLVFGATVWGVFGIICLCNPVQTYWNVSIDGRCMDAEHHFWSRSIIGIVIDWAIWILPVPVVGDLSLPKRQKWGLWALFGLGGFECMVSVLRLSLVHKALHEGKTTRSGIYAVVWSTIELNVAIICASLLVMKPLYAKWIPAMVTEQPMSAREDTRELRRLTGIALLAGSLEGDEKAAE